MFKTKNSAAPAQDEDTEQLLMSGSKTQDLLIQLQRSNRHLKIAVSVLTILLVALFGEFAVVLHRGHDFKYINEHVLKRPPIHYTVESLTRDVGIVPIHSHNDEWRRVPFFDALTKGANSIEADVWYLPEQPGKLFVGHNKAYLKDVSTLDHLYLEPLWHLLIDANSEVEEGDINGIFYDNPEATTYFYVDVKSDGVETIQILEDSLRDFVERGFLTTFNETSGQFIQGPITVVVTGAYPYEYIVGKHFRYMFIDAPLHLLADEAHLYPAQNVSVFASSSLEQITGLKNKPWNYVHGISDEGLSKIDDKLALARELGLRTRIWETPAWPVHVRNGVWRQLLEAGVDYLNVDELKDAVNEFW